MSGGLALVQVSAHDATETAEEMLARMSDPPDMRDLISYMDAFIRRCGSITFFRTDANSFKRIFHVNDSQKYYKEDKNFFFFFSIFI